MMGQQSIFKWSRITSPHRTFLKVAHLQESMKKVVLIPALAPTQCLQFISSRIQNKGLANEMHEQSSSAQCGSPE